MATPETIARQTLGFVKWLEDNQDKVGTPEYTQVAHQYRRLRMMGAGEQPSSTVPAPPEPTVSGQINRDLGQLGSAITGTARGLVGTVPAGEAAARMVTNPVGTVMGLTRDVARDALPGLVPEGTPGSLATPGLVEPVMPESSDDFVGRAAEIMGGGLIGGPSGMARSAVVRGLPRILSATTRTVAPNAAAGLGGASFGEIGEAVAGDVGRFAGELLGGVVAPGTASGLVSAGRGMRDPRATETLAAADSLGVPVSAALVGNESVRGIDNAIAAIPVVRNPGDRLRAEQMDALQAGNVRAAGRTAPTPVLDPAGAGQRVQDAAGRAVRAMDDEIAAFEAQVERAAGGPDAPVDLTRTRNRLVELQGQTSPSSQRRLQGQIDDLDTMATITTSPVGPLQPAARLDQTRDFRTEIGRATEQGGLPGGQASQVYGPLTDDIRTTVTRSGDMTPEEFDAGMSRTAQIRQVEQPPLRRLAESDKVGDIANEVFVRGQINPELLDRVLRNVSIRDRARIRGDAVELMGRAKPGQQTTVEGTDFSPSTFLTNWARTSPETRDLLAPPGSPARQMLDDVATVSGALRGRDRTGNPSGSARMAAAITAPLVLIQNPSMAALAALISVSSGSPRIQRMLANQLTSVPPTEAEQVMNWVRRAGRASATIPDEQQGEPIP